LSVDAIVDSALAEGQLPGALRFPRSQALADIDALGKGPHLLRHTVASRMVTNGASLKHVADVLRHRSLDSAFIYTRIDLPTLRAVAMPWPQVP
jgi:site-specific recombinase XerD